MLDFKFEDSLRKFIVENKPSGTLDVHIYCSGSGDVEITENYSEELEEEIREQFEDVIETLKDQVEYLEDELGYEY